MATVPSERRRLCRSTIHPYVSTNRCADGTTTEKRFSRSIMDVGESTQKQMTPNRFKINSRWVSILQKTFIFTMLVTAVTAGTKKHKQKRLRITPKENVLVVLVEKLAKGNRKPLSAKSFQNGMRPHRSALGEIEKVGQTSTGKEYFYVRWKDTKKRQRFYSPNFKFRVLKNDIEPRKPEKRLFRRPETVPCTPAVQEPEIVDWDPQCTTPVNEAIRSLFHHDEDTTASYQSEAEEEPEVFAVVKEFPYTDRMAVDGAGQTSTCQRVGGDCTTSPTQSTDKLSIGNDYEGETVPDTPLSAISPLSGALPPKPKSYSHRDYGSCRVSGKTKFEIMFEDETMSGKTKYKHVKLISADARIVLIRTLMERGRVRQNCSYAVLKKIGCPLPHGPMKLAEDVEFAKREIDILRRIGSERNTRFLSKPVKVPSYEAMCSHFEVCRRDKTDCYADVLLEVCYGGDLLTLLETISEEGGQLDLNQIVSYLAQIALGVRNLHRMGIVHRDIRPENILLSAEGEIRIADFGLSRDVHLQNPKDFIFSTENIGCYQYRSPEEIAGEKYNAATDVWAIGCVLYDLFSGGELLCYWDPHEDDDMKMLHDDISKRGTRYYLFDDIRESRAEEGVEDLIAIMVELLVRDPIQRYENFEKLISDIESGTGIFGICEDWKDTSGLLTGPIALHQKCVRNHVRKQAIEMMRDGNKTAKQKLIMFLGKHNMAITAFY